MADPTRVPDEPQDTPGDEGAAEAVTRYFFLPRDEVLARLEDGWRSQVFSGGEWKDYPELDIAGEGNEISEQEALQQTQGEFAPSQDAAAPPPEAAA